MLLVTLVAANWLTLLFTLPKSETIHVSVFHSRYSFDFTMTVRDKHVVGVEDELCFDDKCEDRFCSRPLRDATLPRQLITVGEERVPPDPTAPTGEDDATKPVYVVNLGLASDHDWGKQSQALRKDFFVFKLRTFHLL